MFSPGSHGFDRLGLAEVFDAEATGVLEGLKAALSVQQAPGQMIVICFELSNFKSIKISGAVSGV
ncbi:hypothetical protein S40293_10320 [Stachybotrys chartarum IBT 40293]|nr:hypothetical protein S40293_10320 [Stachybotrys chartarum IBT 40293]